MPVVRDPRDFKVRSVAQIDWNDDATIVNFVEGRWQRRDQVRSQIEKQWYYNIAQFLGYQYHYMDGLTGVMMPTPAKYQGQIRLICNRLMVYARKNIAKGMRQKPTWQSLPATTEDADLKVAKANTKILAYYWRYLHMDRKLLDFWTWLTVTGNVFARVYWDPDLGSEMDVSQDLSQITPEQMAMLGDNTSLNLGDAVIDTCSPFEIDPDPECLSLDEAKYLIHTKIRGKEYLEDKYGITGLRTDTSEDQSITRYYEKRIQTLVGPQGGFEAKNTDEEENSVLTHTLWVNPTKKYPNGWVAVVGGGKLLSKGPIPNRFKRAPYVHAVEVTVPGRFWGTCALEQAISLQADYNRTRSQICENRNRLANPKVLYYTGSGIDEGNWGNGIGEMAEVNTPALKPEYMMPPAIPEDLVFKSLEYTLKDMEDITAVHEVCASEDSEALTRSGWKKHTEINEGEEILTFNMQLGIAEWKPIEKITRYEWATNIWHLKNKTSDFLITGNHRWPTLSRRGRWRITKTEDLSGDMKIPRCAPLAYEEQKQVYTDEEAELICWYITEGNYHVNPHGQQRVRISQSRTHNPAYCERIETVLEKAYPGEWKAYEQKDGCVQYMLTYENAEHIRALCPDKKLTPGIVMNMTPEQRKNAEYTLLCADGCFGGVTPRFATTEIDTANAFQMLLALNGKSGQLSCYPQRRKKPIYLVSVKRQGFMSVNELEMTKEPYSGIVWCPTTDNETWLMRRNGKITFTGNTQARAPSGVRAGTAIAQLQEMDDQTLAPTFMLVEKAIAQLGSWLLQVLADNINEERAIKLVGNDKQIEALTFTGNSLYGPNQKKPGVNYFDVEVQMGSQLPLTKIQRRDYAIGLVQAGILNPIEDKKKIYQILDLGTEEPAMNDEAQDRQNAMHENMQMSQGFLVETNPWDNDMVHMDELRRYQKQPEFQELVKMNPMVVQVFEQHFSMHAMKVQSMMAPPVPQGDPNQQDMANNAPPAAGGPSPEQIQAPPPPQEPMNANL